MEEKKISIIIPVYKVEKYLDKCIASVINQTYKNLEVILVDDGSPDICPKICDEWAEKDNRIQVIHKANGGLSEARNCGLDIMTGDYVMFVDSDDYLDLTICDKLHNLIEKYNVGFAMCGVQIVNESYESINEIKKIDQVLVYKEFEAMRQLLHTNFNYLMTAWAKLYNAKIFKDIRYPVGKLHEDEFVIANIIYEANSFVYLNENLYYYLQRTQSIMSTKTDKNVENIFEAYKKRYAFLNKKYTGNIEILKSYLNQLRGLYLCTNNKTIKKNILNEFNLHYEMLNEIDFKNFLFKNLRIFYSLLYRLKNRKGVRK